MARPKSKGAYVPLAAQYFMDDAILEAGPEAELLFVRCLSFLASVSSDGFVTEGQVKKIIGLGLRNVPRRVDSLLRVGLLEARPGGFVARSWTKWNRSAEEINKELAKDRLRKADKQAELNANSGRIPGGMSTENVLQSSTEQSSTEQSKVVAESRPDVERVCDLLADLVERNGSKRPSIDKRWRDAARLMIDADKRPIGEAIALMHWCQTDTFWRANILAMPSFRKRYDQLRLSRERPSTGADRTRDGLTLIQQLREEESIDQAIRSR